MNSTQKPFEAVCDLLKTRTELGRVDSLGADVGVLIAGVTHLTKARDEEVVAPVV